MFVSLSVGLPVCIAFCDLRVIVDFIVLFSVLSVASLLPCLPVLLCATFAWWVGCSVAELCSPSSIIHSMSIGSPFNSKCLDWRLCRECKKVPYLPPPPPFFSFFLDSSLTIHSLMITTTADWPLHLQLQQTDNYIYNCSRLTITFTTAADWPLHLQLQQTDHYIYNCSRLTITYTTAADWPLHLQLQKIDHYIYNNSRLTITFTTAEDWPLHLQLQQNDHYIYNCSKLTIYNYNRLTITFTTAADWPLHLQL